MTTAPKPVPGSNRPPLPGIAGAPRVTGAEPIIVSIYLKPAEAAPPGPALAERPALAAARGETLGPVIDRLTAFAADHGLTVVAADAARRLVQLSGPASQLEAAFGTALYHLELGGRRHRVRQGELHLPADIAPHVLAVLGLDDRPAATPKFVAARAVAASHLPSEVAALYGFPVTGAAGQCIGIIELGGGYTAADNSAAFQAMRQAVPNIVAIGVDGAVNAPGDGSGADGEVALDIQVAGGAAPGARIAVYFAPNTDQGFVDAISQAVHDAANQPSVLSISWGSAEANWTAQGIAAMHAAFQDAAQLGVSVCAASGDALATDGVSDGKAHVDYPASDPFVLGCGGTHIAVAGGAISAETVWKSNGGGTGGGISANFPLPDYQAKAGVPAAAHPTRKKKKAPAPAPGAHRGVPDVSGNADPDSGYAVFTGGQRQVIGGTSAVAPLWAALIAVLNAARGKPLGYLHAQLYAHPAAFRDIVQGDNKVKAVGYDAAPGWDPCTGLGSPDGAKLLAALR